MFFFWLSDLILALHLLSVSSQISLTLQQRNRSCWCSQWSFCKARFTVPLCWLRHFSIMTDYLIRIDFALCSIPCLWLSSHFTFSFFIEVRILEVLYSPDWLCSWDWLSDLLQYLSFQHVEALTSFKAVLDQSMCLGFLELLSSPQDRDWAWTFISDSILVLVLASQFLLEPS